MLRTHESYPDSAQKHEYTPGSYHSYSRYPSTFSYPNQCHDNLVYVVPSDSSESTNGEPITKNAGSRWREDETEALVEIWRDKICQTRWWKQSKGVRVNKEMWEEIGQILSERDVFRTPSQCQIRMKNLLQFYRQTIDNRRSEKSMDDLPEYFDIVDSIMTRREGNLVSNDEKGVTTEMEENIPVNMDENNNERERKRPYAETVNLHEANTPDERNNETAEKKFDPEHVRKIEDNQNGRIPNDYRPYTQSNSVNMLDFLPKEQYKSHWSTTNNCCDGQPSPKKIGLTNDKDYSSRPQEMHMGRRYLHVPPAYHRQNVHLPDRRYQGNHTCTGADSCNTQACYNKSNGMNSFPSVSKNMMSNTENEWHVCNNGSSLRFIQELLNLQYKQMENFLEIEKKRLATEEKRLKEEREAGNRNSAFLMEAVKILAETFRNEESTKEVEK